MTSTEDRIGRMLKDGIRRAEALADVNNLTDAYRLKVLTEEIEKLKKKMAKRGSAVPLCAGDEADHDDTS